MYTLTKKLLLTGLIATTILSATASAITLSDVQTELAAISSEDYDESYGTIYVIPTSSPLTFTHSGDTHTFSNGEIRIYYSNTSLTTLNGNVEVDYHTNREQTDEEETVADALRDHIQSLDSDGIATLLTGRSISSKEANQHIDHREVTIDGTTYFMYVDKDYDASSLPSETYTFGNDNLSASWAGLSSTIASDEWTPEFGYNEGDGFSLYESYNEARETSTTLEFELDDGDNATVSFDPIAENAMFQGEAWTFTMVLTDEDDTHTFTGSFTFTIDSSGLLGTSALKNASDETVATWTLSSPDGNSFTNTITFE